jgi:fused signal recognition particle receptor
MSFFGKLKDRLFKSSSRLDEGLSQIVGEGEPEAVEAPPAPEPIPTLAAPAPVQPAAPAPAPPAPPHAPAFSVGSSAGRRSMSRAGR